jgi:hypothetical protein
MSLLYHVKFKDNVNTDGILVVVILHAEILGAIEIVHVVDCEHQAARVEVEELVVVQEYILRAEVRIAHRLRVHIEEGPRLHIQVGATVEGVVPQYEIVEG